VAAEFFRSLGPDEDLAIHEYVLVEAAALVQSRLGRQGLRALFLDLLPRMSVRQVSERERQAAVSSLLAGSMKVSLVDWTSFEIMRTEGMREAFAFDEDFRKQGFITVP
jgi:predicted nucleic acid-binding protein